MLGWPSSKEPPETSMSRLSARTFSAASSHRHKQIDDNIVRVTARQLRAKLEEYYQDEGKEGSARLISRRGAIHPSFGCGPNRKPLLHGSRQTALRISPNRLP